MLSNVVNEGTQESSVPGPETIVSVLISNYPLVNGGYLVSFGKYDSEASFTKYDPFASLDFEASELSKYLDFSSIYLPQGCFYLRDTDLADFIRSLASGASVFRIKLLPASAQTQGILLIMVDEDSLSKYEQKEED